MAVQQSYSVGSPLNSFQTLWLAVFVVLIGDTLTTLYGLSIGLTESNPFVKGILEGYGLGGMVVLKGVCVLWTLVIWKQLGKRYGKAALLGLFVPWGIAVVLNLLAIVQHP